MPPISGDLAELRAGIRLDVDARASYGHPIAHVSVRLGTVQSGGEIPCEHDGDVGVVAFRPVDDALHPFSHRGLRSLAVRV